MSLQGGTTKQSHGERRRLCNVRLPRYARNDMERGDPHKKVDHPDHLFLLID